MEQIPARVILSLPNMLSTQYGVTVMGKYGHTKFVVEPCREEVPDHPDQTVVSKWSQERYLGHTTHVCEVVVPTNPMDLRREFAWAPGVSEDIKALFRLAVEWFRAHPPKDPVFRRLADVVGHPEATTTERG